MSKVRIGITMFSGREGQRRYTKVQANYVESVYTAGGIPVLIPTCEDTESAVDFLRGIDGIVFTGGEDVSPLVYGEDPLKELGYADIRRDRWEIALYTAALETGIPILGICRGIQLMNVAEGGTVYQDINSQTESRMGHFPRELPMESLHHYIDIEPESRVHRIFGRDRLLVNSFHHQAIKDAAKVFRISARSADGIIEAVERPDRAFVIGLQFHAEALPPLDPYYLAPFSAMIKAARES